MNKLSNIGRRSDDRLFKLLSQTDSLPLWNLSLQGDKGQKCP